MNQRMARSRPATTPAPTMKMVIAMNSVWKPTRRPGFARNASHAAPAVAPSAPTNVPLASM